MKKYELRRYTATTGGIGESVLRANRVIELLSWLYDVIQANKYTFHRHGRTFTIESSPYGRQNKQFKIIKL